MSAVPLRIVVSGSCQTAGLAAALLHTASGQVDPVTQAVRIRADERVATLGSCFPQRRQFGYFSARYGNVYTVRQVV